MDAVEAHYKLISYKQAYWQALHHTNITLLQQVTSTTYFFCSLSESSNDRIEYRETLQMPLNLKKRCITVIYAGNAPKHAECSKHGQLLVLMQPIIFT